MSELSPAAQAVDDAFWKIINDKWNIYDRRRAQIAAALRAAVDQVLPEVVNAVGDEHDDARHDQWVRIRCKFFAIAAELEAQ
jgi:hypothetical protein